MRRHGSRDTQLRRTPDDKRQHVRAADQRQPAAPAPRRTAMDRIEFDNAAPELIKNQSILRCNVTCVKMNVKKATARYLGWLVAIPARLSASCRRRLRPDAGARPACPARR
jgi:hypothetical protein